MSDKVQAFSNFADFYQQSTRVTAAIADYGLTLLQPPLTANSIIHDNACGPGVVSFVIADRFAASEDSISHTIPRIYGTDLAPGMLTAMDREIQKRGSNLAGRISTQLLDARDLRDFEDGKFTHSITNFAIMVDEDGANIAAEIYRTLRPDSGVALVTTWERSAGELMDAVCARIRPGQALPRIMAPEWKTKEKLVDALVRGGFEEGRIEIYSKETDAGFGSEEERWTYFCHPFWGMWRKGWSEEETARWDEVVREEVVRFAGEGGGFVMRAWVAVARK